MDVLAAAKMKATTTVTLLLTFLIAVGCSASVINVAIQSIVVDVTGEVPDETIANKIYEDAAIATDDTFSGAVVVDGEVEGASAKGVISFENIQDSFLRGCGGCGVAIIGDVKNVKNVKNAKTLVESSDRRIEVGDHDDVSITIKEEEEVKVGSFIVIKGKVEEHEERMKVVVTKVVRASLRTPLGLASLGQVALGQDDESTCSTCSSTGVQAVSGLWIKAGIFSLTVLFAVALALISWTLQRKTKVRHKKTSLSKEIK